jgi:hypothetical protein
VEIDDIDQDRTPFDSSPRLWKWAGDEGFREFSENINILPYLFDKCSHLLHGRIPRLHEFVQIAILGSLGPYAALFSEIGSGKLEGIGAMSNCRNDFGANNVSNINRHMACAEHFNV